jgi:hypothetical protein
MADLKHCDRCKKAVEMPNEIGVILEVSKFATKRGYVRPSKVLLDAAKKSEPTIEYFPLVFTESFVGEIDLCSECFIEFMNPKNQKLSPPPVESNN